MAAYYVAWINGPKYTIIIEWAVPPMKPYFPPEFDDSPPIHKLSDFTYLALEWHCRELYGTNNPNYAPCIWAVEWIVHLDVAVDQDTAMVGKRVTGSDWGWRTWPGQEFNTKTDAGKALVGCE